MLFHAVIYGLFWEWTLVTWWNFLMVSEYSFTWENRRAYGIPTQPHFCPFLGKTHLLESRFWSKSDVRLGKKEKQISKLHVYSQTWHYDIFLLRFQLFKCLEKCSLLILLHVPRVKHSLLLLYTGTAGSSIATI